MSLFQKRSQVYCAFCKTARVVYQKRRVGVADVIGSAFGAGALMLALFQDWDPRYFFILVGLLAVTEIILQLRWRMGIVCPHCGFDPVLYLREPQKAAEKVRLSLEDRRNNPATVFARPLHVPYRKVKMDSPGEAKSSLKGQNISRTI